MKIALAQMQMSINMDDNYLKTINLIEEAGKKDANLIIFPEIQLSPFFPQYEKSDASKYLLKIDSEYVKGICDACKRNKIYASPNLYIEENNKTYDMNLLIDKEGKIIGKQKMLHIAQCEKFYEQDYYTPSEDGFQVFDTEIGKIGIVICFDRHYPESIRTNALKGAELIIIPTANTTSEPMEMFEWEIKVQSFQNSVNIAMCNRVGIEDEMNFYGESLIIDYNGNIIFKASNNEELAIIDIDLENTTNIRNKKPYTNLRQKKFYL